MKKPARPPSINYPLSAAIAAALLGGSQLASAQTAPAETLEEITVTGYRHSIQAALDEKKVEVSLVEIVTQEDIGKLPDPSVAESISRLSGVAGQRVNGRVQDISVRGFSGDFVTTLLNGREQASTGDNRAVEFDQYPAEIVQSVVVYKTTDAERVSQGLAGTINLRTVRPLSVDKDQTFAVGLRGERNSLGILNAEGKDEGYRFNATYIGKFADNTLGLALGYARLESPEEQQHYKAWWFGNDGPPGNFGTPPQNATTLDGAEYYAYSRNDVRDGLVGVLEWKPNENLHSVTDLYYSKYSQKSYDRGWEGYLLAGGPVTNPTITDISGISFVTSGTYNNFNNIVLNQYQERKDKLYAIGENLESTIGGWKANADLSYSYAEREEKWIETYAGYKNAPGAGYASDTVAFQNATSGLPTLTPGLNYADASKMYLGDPAIWGGWGHDGTEHDPIVTDKIKSVRLSAEHPLDGFFSRISTGIALQQRDKSKDVAEYNLNLLNGRTPVTVPAGLLVPATTLGGGAGSVISYNVLDAVAQLYSRDPILDSNHYTKNWSVSEKLTSAFVQFDVRSHIGTYALAGNLGVQVVHANQSSTGFDQIPNTNPIVVSSTTQGASYTDVLPSLNHVLDFTNETLLRLSAGKQMVRPRMEDLKGSIDAGVDVLTRRWSGSGGNPQLRPWRAWAYDLTFEKYFAKNSYVSLGAWYKDLKSFIYTGVSDPNFDFSNFNNNGITPSVANGNIGTMSRPANQSGGNARGLEAAATFDAGLIASSLNGLGAQVAMAWTKSSIPPDPNTGPTLPGLSPKVRTITVYYERAGFQARLSERWRQAYVGGVESLFAGRGYSQILDDRQLDGSIGYTVQSGSAKNLSISLLAQNINNSPYRDTTGTFSSGVQTPQTYDLYGRTYLLGVGYKF